jgi:cell division protein FtsN
MSRENANRTRKKSGNRNSRVKPSRKPIPGWIWLGGGIFIGVLVTGLYDSIRNPNATTANEQTAAIEAQPENDKPRHQPRFDFYTLLQESEVVIPDEGATGPQPKTVIVPEPSSEPENNAANEVASQSSAATVSEQSPTAEPAAKVEVSKPKPPTKPAATSAEKTVYVLQAGSFKNPDDADSVRANLLLLNMRVNIETVPAGNNQTWHRVLVGPFDNTADLSAAKAQLTRNGIDSIQLKRRM